MDGRRKGLHYRNMRTIPIYSLYGEAQSQRQEGWLHWETIQSRSRLHGYRIAPHRHPDFFQVLSLTGGSAQVTLDASSFEVVAPAVIVVPALTVHGFDFNSGVEGIVVTLMERDVRELGGSLPPAGVLQTGTDAVVEGLSRLIGEADRPAGDHDLAMRALIALLVVALRRAHHLPPSADKVLGRARRHAQAFRDLVDARFRETRRIAEYAREIGVSPTHLNRVCRQVLGHSALEVIERRIAIEVRRQLVFSSLPIKQIGAELGYEDPAYFSRAMSRLLGEAPAPLRERLRQTGSSTG